MIFFKNQVECFKSLSNVFTLMQFMTYYYTDINLTSDSSYQIFKFYKTYQPKLITSVCCEIIILIKLI